MGEEEEPQQITGQKRAWEPGGPPEGPPPDAAPTEEAAPPPVAEPPAETAAPMSTEPPPEAPAAPPAAEVAPANGAPSAEEQALQGEAAYLRHTNAQLQTQLAQLQQQHAQLTQQQRAAQHHAAQQHAAAAQHHHMMQAQAQAHQQAAPAAPRPVHNPQWTEQVNPENGTTYYWNSATQESTYTRPADYNPPGPGAAGHGGPNMKGPPGANLFVVRKMRRGEYDEFNDNDLRAEFGKFGTVTRAEMTIDKDTGWSKGFGFVSFATVPEADAAISAVHGSWMAGREMKVEKTRED